RRPDDEVDPLPEDVQLEVGDEDGHLDEGVVDDVQAGHLAVDPDDAVGQRTGGAGFGHAPNPKVHRPVACRVVSSSHPWQRQLTYHPEEPVPENVTARPALRRVLLTGVVVSLFTFCGLVLSATITGATGITGVLL